MNASSRIGGWRSVGAVIVALALAALACGGEVEPTATPLPRPTQRPVATATKNAPDPTARPSATVESSLLDLEPYTHPSGAFSLDLPSGWQQEEFDSRVLVTSPDAVVVIDITLYNAGQPLDADSLANFIHAVEDNWFATFPNYEAGDLEPQSDGSIGVAKTLELRSGTPQTVLSYYWQDANVIYETDFWVDSDAYADYLDGLLEVVNSMTTDPVQGAKQDVYSIIYTFTGPNDYFEFAVPFGWTYATDTPENMVVDTFTAPDRQSFIENITYDDGQPVDDISAFAKQLLTDYYNLDDVEITSEEEQPDGSIRLDWTSASSGFVGETFVERREPATAVLVLTWVVTEAAHDLYLPVWDYLLKTYAIPEPE